MSVYDPFQLYTHHQKKSHDGQVIRKKLIPPQNYAISEEMVKQAQEILIKAGIRGFNSLAPKRLFIFKQYPKIEATNLSIPPGEYDLILTFSNFWDGIKADFASIYNTVSPLSVQQITFQINLISVIYGPRMTSSGGSGAVWYQFVFDGYSTPSSTFADNFGSGNFSIQCISYSDTQWFRSFHFANSSSDYSSFVSRQTQTSHPYLTQKTNNSPAILTVLKNSDYSVYNPELIRTHFANTTQDTFTISNVIHDITVELAVEYK